jgi:hypothetical protein
MARTAHAPEGTTPREFRLISTFFFLALLLNSLIKGENKLQVLATLLIARTTARIPRI